MTTNATAPVLKRRPNGDWRHALSAGTASSGTGIGPPERRPIREIGRNRAMGKASAFTLVDLRERAGAYLESSASGYVLMANVDLEVSLTFTVCMQGVHRLALGLYPW
jgi:hypothetical protein